MKNNLERKIGDISIKFAWNQAQLAPRDAFVRKLEAQLADEVMKTNPSPFWKISHVPVWLYGFVLLLLMAVVVSLVGTSKVYAGVLKLLGYVDGFGIVNTEGSLRTIGYPASLTRGDITVTVYDAMFTTEKTELRYSVTGLNNSDYAHTANQEECREPEKIRLPDGTTQSIQSPIPDAVDSIELILTCIPGTIIGQIPGDWTIPVVISPGQDTIKVYPLEEHAPTAMEAYVPASALSKAEVYIEVGRVVKTDDGFILIGTEVTRRPAGWTVIRTNLSITDANSQAVKFKYPDSATSGSDLVYGIDRSPWAIQFNAQGVAFPIKISTESKAFEPISGDEKAKITVDVGQNPQVGDVIEVKQTVAFAGDIVQLNKITVYQDGYGFDLSLGNQISNLNVSLENCKGFGSGGVRFAAIEPETINQSIFCETRPAGRITIVLTDAFSSHDRRTTEVFWSPDE